MNTLEKIYWPGLWSSLGITSYHRDVSGDTAFYGPSFMDPCMPCNSELVQTKDADIYFF